MVMVGRVFARDTEREDGELSLRNMWRPDLAISVNLESLKNEFEELEEDCKAANSSVNDQERQTGIEEESEERRLFCNEKLTDADLLSDPEEGCMYHNDGLQAVQDGKPTMPSGFSMFENRFGGGLFGMPRRKSNPRTDSLGVPLEVTLEDLFNGKSTSVEYPRKILCSKCKGIGFNEDNVISCKKCNGRGICIQPRQIGPGKVQHLHSVCSGCGREGETFKSKDRCKKCKGKKVLDETKKLDVFVEPGMKDGEKIQFSGMSNEQPGHESGDVLVTLRELDHTVFRREGQNLYMKKKITLVEALCGFQFSIDFLDERTLLMKCKPGDVVRPGVIREVKDYGMPLRKHPELRGNLYVEFKIEFPESIGSKEVEELKSLLPERPAQVEVGDEDMKEVVLMDFDTTRGAGGNDDYADGMEEEERGGPGVGCATS